MKSVNPDHAQRLIVHVAGRVQGVGYRHFIRVQARQFGLTGWVRNEQDGSVTFEAEGMRTALEALLDAARKGPPGARVKQASAQWAPATGRYDSFEVRYF